MLLPQQVAKLQPVHLGHHDVEQDEVVALLAALAEQLAGIGDALHRAASRLEELARQRQDVGIVVHEQHALPGLRFAARRSSVDERPQLGDDPLKIERTVQDGVRAFHRAGFFRHRDDARVGQPPAQRGARMGPARVGDHQVRREGLERLQAGARAQRAGGDAPAGEEVSEQSLIDGVLVEQHRVADPSHVTTSHGR